jgi:multidrug resistance efflux pump
MNESEKRSADLEQARRNFENAFSEYLAASRMHEAGAMDAATLQTVREKYDDADVALRQIERHEG